MSLPRFTAAYFFVMAVFAANPASSDNLLELYSHALDADPQYAAARAQSEAGEARFSQGQAGLLPQVSLNGQMGWSGTSSQTPRGRERQRHQARSYGVQLVQPLYRRETWIAFEQGKVQQSLAEARLRSAGQDLMLKAAVAYFDVLKAEDLQEAVGHQHIAAVEQLASVRKRFDLGELTIIDVNEVMASIDRVGAQVVKARSDLALARHALASSIGRQPGTLKRLSEGASMALPSPYDVELWVDAAKRGSPEVCVQELLVVIAANELRIADAKHLPTVDLVVNKAMQQNTDASTERSDRLSVGVRLSMPIFSGGGINAASREASALLMQSRYELEGARRDAALAARDAWSGVVDGIALIAALKAAKVSAQQAVDANTFGYRVGARVGMDILKAQSELTGTAQEYARARYDTLVAQLRLKAAVGTLHYDDLAQVNALLGRDPDASKGVSASRL